MTPRSRRVPVEYAVDHRQRTTILVVDAAAMADASDAIDSGVTGEDAVGHRHSRIIFVDDAAASSGGVVS